MSSTEMPRIAVCFITQNREKLSSHYLRLAKQRAGIECDFIGLDQASTDNIVEAVRDIATVYFKEQNNIGVASGFNKLWNLAKLSGYDFIATIGNDIELPENWLKEFYDTYQALGMIHQYAAIHSVEKLPNKLTKLNGKEVYISDTIFGCTFFNAKLLDYVGYFNTAFNPYGLEDGEYNYRCQKSGVTCYYLGIGTAEHKGEPYGADDKGEYRKAKDESLKKNGEIYRASIEEMEINKNYYKSFKI